MLLVHRDKAGSPELETYYTKQISDLQKERQKISSRISPHETIAIQDQVTLYNSWLYVAIHILCAIKEHQTRKSLRKYLNLDSGETDPIINFLIEHGVLSESQGRLKQGATRIHLPRESPFLVKHHVNWRMKAIQSLDRERADDLHYSMVMSLSKSDVEKMKEIVLRSIKEVDHLLKVTGDEVAYSFCVD